MYAEEILEFLKDRVSQDGYDSANIFMKSKNRKWGLFKRKFVVKPVPFGKGYYIYASTFDDITVY